MDFMVNIDVDDIARAERFYREAFGLRPGRRLGPGALEMLDGPVPLWLLQREQASSAVPGAGATRDYARHWTPVHLDFVVEDIDRALATAVAAGARLEQEVSTHAWGRLAPMADPFGHGFCLIQFLGRGYDEAATPRTPDSPKAP
ncbi:MAG TPA: VOC family protein [Noviherbaspirillum sp.]|jgi:predicted enzyme related to lactoylglutathione lyase|uniref:VOC family protein n=1 Tax=Noviherbaspirillum sp. TaxID=1926288 RepID=UPI002F9317FF